MSIEGLNHTGTRSAPSRTSKAVASALALARVAPLALLTACGGCDGSDKAPTGTGNIGDTWDTGDSAVDSAETGKPSDSNDSNDSNGGQDSDTQPGDSQDTSADTATEREPESTSSAAECAARLDMDIRDVATDQRIDSLGAAASLEAGVFKDSNFQVTGENATGIISACVYDSSRNPANETRVYRAEGNIISVEADTTATDPNVFVLRFTTAEDDLISRSDSANAAWTYEVGAGGSVTDTSL